MFKLEKLNVVKIVSTEYEKEKLLTKGFKEVVIEKKEEKPTKEKAAK